MNSGQLILEKLGHNKLFKEVRQSIWKVLLSSGINSRNIDIKSNFNFYTDRMDIVDLPNMDFEVYYKWDLKTCSIDRKVGDFIVFGIDLSRVDLDISERVVRRSIEYTMSYDCPGKTLGSLFTNGYLSFYKYCKNSFGKDDEYVVSLKDVKDFFKSDDFYFVINNGVSLLVDLWDEDRPLKGIFDGAGEDLLPLVFYYIPDMSCYYIRRGGADPFSFKLDIKHLSKKSFECVSFNDFVSGKKVELDIFRPAIKNDFVR